MACEVVPGITAAVRCAAATGLPLTHRDLAQGLVLVTAHRREDLDWRLLANTVQTVAVSMGVGRAGDIGERLVAARRDPDAPVAIVQDGTTIRQRVVLGSVGKLAELVRREDVRSPALIYTGETAGLVADDAGSAADLREHPEVWSPLALAG